MNIWRWMRAATACIPLLICAVAYGQVGTWQLVSHMNIARAVPGAGVGTDGRIYVFGGQGASGQAMTAAEVYDTKLDTWTVLPPMPQGRMFPTVLTASDGRLFVVGGNDNAFAYVTSIDAFDPTSNTWSHITDVPQTVTPFATMAAGDNIFILTGSGINAIEYSISGNSWQTVSFPFFIPSNGGTVVSKDGKMYIIGGVNNSFQPTNTLSFFDTSNYASGSLAAMVSARVDEAASFGGDGRLYAISGNFVSGTIHDVEAYDPVANTWSQAANVLLDRPGAAAAEGPNGRVYFIGGQGLSVLDEVEMYQPAMLKAQGLTINPQEGISFTGGVANITDPNLNLGAGDFTATINWGDGSPTSLGTVAAGVNPGTYVVTGTHTYGAVGPYTVSVHIQNTDGENLTVAGAASVSDAALDGSAINFSATTSVAFSGKVGTFTDANTLETGSNLTAAINWGDGVISSGTVSLNVAGGFDVSGLHTYAAGGVYTFSVTMTDSGGSSKKVLGTATVSSPAPLLNASTINATEGAVFSGAVGSFTDSDPSVVAGSFTASIDWGDGTVTTGSVGPNGSGGFTVSGLHTYAEEGVYTTHVTVTVTAGGASSTSSGGAVVADAPLTGSGFNLIVKSRAFSGTVANFSDADPFGVASDYSATIFWGDGATSTGTISAVTGGFKVAGSHTYLKKAIFTVKVNIKDVGGSLTSVTTTINASQAK